MNINFKDILLLTSSTTLFFSPTANLYAAQTSCDAGSAVHCVALNFSSPSRSGKFIKIKESQKGLAPVTTIMCASPQMLLSLTQAEASQYLPGDHITWQFSQCIDEDCSNSKFLSEDKFTITKSGKVYSSGPKKSADVILDPNYGQACNTKQINDSIPFKNHLVNSSVEMRIADAVGMLEAVPVALTKTAEILHNMRAVATDVAENSHTPQEIINLNNQFQTLKETMKVAQRVNTLDGYKSISGGTITINIGSWYSLAPLSIPLPATTQSALNISSQDVLSKTDANYAILAIDYALNIVNYAQSVKK